MQNSHEITPRIIHSGCDGLTVALQGNFTKKALDLLETKKAIAEELGQDLGMSLQGREFSMMPKGTGAKMGYAYQFHTGKDGIKYQVKKSLDASQWNLRVRVSAMFMAVNGIAMAHKEIYEDLRAFGAIIIDESVSNVDFCIDMVLDEIGTKRKDAFALVPENFIHHSKVKKQRFYSEIDGDEAGLSVVEGRYIETVTMGGKQSRQLCVYNKRAEQVQKRRKEWFELWGVDKDDYPAIWRAEFRFGKRFLKDWNVKTLQDVQDCYGDILADSLLKIRYIERGEDSNLSRAPNHIYWDAVISGFSDMILTATSGITRGRVRAVQREECKAGYMAQIMGLAASLSEVEDFEASNAGMKDFAKSLNSQILKYIEFDFEKLVKTRRKARDRLIFIREKFQDKTGDVQYA